MLERKRRGRLMFGFGRWRSNFEFDFWHFFVNFICVAVEFAEVSLGNK